MKKRYHFAGAVLAALAIGAGALPATAQPADTVTDVATGLNNPRKLEVAPDGSIYVAETGKGGKTCEHGECIGFTGRIVKVVPDGEEVVVHKGLMSIAGRDGSFAVGATDVAVAADNKLSTLVTSLPPEVIKSLPDALRSKVKAQAGKVLRVNGLTSRSGVGNVTRYELKHNPDADVVESNPYSVEKLPVGWAVADAAANAVYYVDPNGGVSLVMVLPHHEVGDDEVHAVPTTVAMGPDGALYIGELGGEGLPQHRSRIWRVVPGQTPEVYAEGFDTIVGIDFGPEGHLFVVELLKDGFSQFGDGSGPPDLTGALMVVPPGGGDATELAAGQLTAPGGVAATADGRIFVSVNSVAVGDGKVVEVDPALPL